MTVINAGGENVKADKEKIMLLMARNCLNLADLAKKAEMPEVTTKNVVYGRNTRPKTIGKVAKALGVDVTEILEKE